jgi:hypothetical protein
VCLTYIKCNPAVFEIHGQNTVALISVNIFHQNIKGLRSKRDELPHSFKIDNINPHILCLSECHMVEQEHVYLTMVGYLFDSSFWWKGLQRGGVCIFVKANQHFNKTDFSSL